MALTAAERAAAGRLGISIDYVDDGGVTRSANEAAVRSAIDTLSSAGPVPSDDVEGPIAACVEPPSSDPDRPLRTWGFVAPLWSLRGPSDHGIGTYGDLTLVGDWVTEHGGSVVATLPMLASFAGEDSPYRPVSRRFWDEVYLDPSMWVSSGPAVGSGADIVDRDAVRAALRDALGPVAVDDPMIESDVDAELRVYARFRAAGERHGLDWRRWPASWRTEVPADAVDVDTVRWFEWSQMQCRRQLAAAADGLRRSGAVLLADLPVGAHPDGFDRWRHRRLFVDGFSIGAPPDGFNLDGQDWGIAPIHPVHAASPEGRAWFRSLLDHHATVAGLLRIDHVMGLHRQWWVPAGHDPVDGVYVRQPARAAWDEIAACSQQHGMAIVAEDLGTVPPEVRREMARRRALGMFVAQSELHPHSASLARRPSPLSVASFGTHDMSPIVPWWSEHGDVSRPVAAARDDVLAQLAASDAAIVLVDAGDVVLDPVQVNV
ncbi:MAG: 4-alpha-glucanotransferase, partial [Acidimicrobiia bacterium]|nr:4-alpha-glucanotransferase [Acidimicrobiia bacterium]